MSLVKKAKVEFDQEALDDLAGRLQAAYEAVEVTSNELLEFRQAVGRTQVQVAAAARVPMFRVAKAEQGKENLPFDDAVAIANWMRRAASGQVGDAEYEQEPVKLRRVVSEPDDDGEEFATDSVAATAPPGAAKAG